MSEQLVFTLSWSKTSSVHFLFLQGIKFQKMPIFHYIYAQNSYSTSHIWTKQHLGIKPDPCPTFTPRSLGCGTFPNMKIIILKLFCTNIKCQTPHMLKCLYSPKQNVKYYLTSLHINEWTMAFTLIWPQNILSPLPVSCFWPSSDFSIMVHYSHKHN